MQSLTGVGGVLSVSHHDLVRNELHGHSYEVWAFWPASPKRDAEALQVTLQEVLRQFDHTVLSEEDAWAEDLARRIGRLLVPCVRVDIVRPLERFRVEVWL